MASLRHVRECLLMSNALNLINDEEFVLLYDLNSTKNPDFPYWKYEKFDLDLMTDDECKAEFRFLKNDIYFLQQALPIPNRIVCYNRVVVQGAEATCILLKRYAYPTRFGDMVPRCGRSAPQLSIIASEMTNLVYNFIAFIQNRYNEWFSNQVACQLKKGADLADVKISSKLSDLKPLHNAWIVDVYNHLCEEPEMIINGFDSAGVTEAVNDAQVVLEHIENPFRA